MSVRNQNWYDLNESRLWPFDDQAELTDDNGLRMPNDLIADIYLRFPNSLGDRAFVSALTVGPGIVTVTILGSGTDFQPMATVSVPRPVDFHRHYELSGAVDGVGGWIVFGKGIDDQESRSFRFSDPLQSTLLAQCARSYRNLPVASLGRLYADEALIGIIKLTGGNDLETLVDQREIDGVVRDVVVIRLADKREGDDTVNLLEEYAGDCGKRPESRNCEDPPPVEQVNSVFPDCCGNIFVEFRGCGDISRLTDNCGVIIDCGFGLSEACVTEDRLPDEDGKLPNEYDDLCEDAVPPSTSTTAPPTYTYVYSTRDPDEDLPYYEAFNNLNSNDFTILLGEWALTQGGGAAGKVSTVTDSGGYARVTFTANPPYGLPSSLEIVLCSVAAYNTEHTVVTVIGSKTLDTDIAYTTNGSGGIWRETDTNPDNPLGNVFEAQEDRENHVIWNEGLPEAVDWDLLYKKFTTVANVQEGSPYAKNNAGLIFGYVDESNFYVAELDIDEAKTFRIMERREGQWYIHSSSSAHTASPGRRYKISVEILPLDPAGSTAGFVNARLLGMDDGLSRDLTGVVLPNFLPATGYVGFYSNRSLSWFEDLLAENYLP